MKKRLKKGDYVSPLALRLYCRDFRKGFLGKNAPAGKCGIMSISLQGLLKLELGIETRIFESTVGDWNHLFLVMDDGHVIDLTADQFNTPNRVYDPVYVGVKLDIHENGEPWEYEKSTDEKGT